MLRRALNGTLRRCVAPCGTERCTVDSAVRAGPGTRVPNALMPGLWGNLASTSLDQGHQSDSIAAASRRARGRPRASAKRLESRGSIPRNDAAELRAVDVHLADADTRIRRQGSKVGEITTGAICQQPNLQRCERPYLARRLPATARMSVWSDASERRAAALSVEMAACARSRPGLISTFHSSPESTGRAASMASACARSSA